VNQRIKSTLLVFFALTTVATGIFAWQQSRTQRTEQNTAADKDRAALEKRLADAEHRAHDLQNQLDALKARMVAEDTPPDEPPPSANNEGDPRDRRGRFRGPEAFMAVMNDPKVVQLMNSREKLMLDSRYAALFKSLSQGGGATDLSPEQLDAFKNLLVEKQNTTRDVMMTARAQGITDRSEINQLVKNAQTELDAQIQNTLGADGFTQYQQYEKTLPQRTLVNQLSQSLSYTSTPLSDSQTQQLVQILADTSTETGSGQRRTGGGPGGFGGFGGPGVGVTITDAAVTQASTVLAPDQLNALTAIQKAQVAQQELTQAMRTARQNAAQPQASTSTGSTANPVKNSR